MECQRRIELIANASDEVREQVSAILDELTRPLTPREIDAQLAPYYTRAKRREIVKALYFLQPIVLLHQHRGKTEKPGWSDHGNGTTAPTR